MGAYTVAFAVYPNEQGAKRTLDVLEQMEHNGTIHIVDAAVLVKQVDGKVKVTDTARHARRKALGAGTLIGGVVGLLFPPGILIGAGLGAAVGGIVGALTHRDAFKNATMKRAAEEMRPGTSAIVAVMEDRWLQTLEKAAEGYDRLMTQGLEAEAAASVTALEAEEPQAESGEER